MAISLTQDEIIERFGEEAHCRISYRGHKKVIKGPKPEYEADRENAEHMIAMTCSHISFLIKKAGI